MILSVQVSFLLLFLYCFMKNHCHTFLTIFITTLLVSCTKEITLDDLPGIQDKIVVEGSIETNSPPLIFLTKNFPYYGDYNLNDISSYFIHDAIVKVHSSDNEEVVLKEFCSRDFIGVLSAAQKTNLFRVFGFNYSLDSIIKYGDSAKFLPNICFYAPEDILFYYISGKSKFMGKEKTSYTLDIVKDTTHITALTTIPTTIRPIGLSYKAHPNATNDSLVTVFVELHVPDTFGNFIRYWTKRNQESFFLPRSRSVWDDKLWVGSSIRLPLERGQPRRTKLDDTYSYFWRDDTVHLKWANIDKKAYDFWSAVERDNGDNPLSSPILVKSNIQGGLGVWAGYSISTLKLYIPKK